MSNSTQQKLLAISYSEVLSMFL